MKRDRSSRNPLGVLLGWAAGTAITSIEQLRDEARFAVESGFDALWVAQVFGVGPLMLAAMARTAQAALGPMMLDLAGQMCAGTSLGPAMSPTVIANRIAPRMNAAAQSAGRPEPRIKAVVSVSVTDDPEGLRRAERESSALCGGLNAYRRMLDLAGLDSSADVSSAGTIDDVVAGMADYVVAGAIELRVGVVSSVAEPTKASLAEWLDS